MVQFYDQIPPFLASWIQQQKLFFVATAPLAQDAHINVSPKGFEGTFHVVDESTVWYEDLSGSGIETIAHIRENQRITLMFVAFEGPPRISRLFGTGTIYEFGTPEYDALLPPERRQPGSRAVVWVKVHKASASCGYSIPFFDYKCPRFKLHNMAVGKELADVRAEESTCPTEAAPPPRPEKGLKWYWCNKNQASIDGLPGLKSAFDSLVLFKHAEGDGKAWWDDERVKRSGGWQGKGKGLVDGLLDGRMGAVLGFAMGMAVAVGCVRLGVV